MRRRELTPILLMAAAVSAGCGQSGPYGTLPGAATGPEFVRLQGGTDVEFDRPEGWTDVVVKLVPQLSTPGGEDLPAAERQAFSFRTVILVEVVKEGRTGDFALRRVGVGLSQPVNGRDTVVTMGSREKLGVALTKESKFALNAAEERLHQSRLIAGTSTFALVGMSANLKSGTGYRKVQLRYALAVDPHTGALTRAVWPVDGERPGSTMSILSGDPVIACPTRVEIDRSFGVVPKGVNFGMADLPKGRALPLPKPLSALAGRGTYTAEQAASLEQEVRATLGGEAPKGEPIRTASTPR